MCTKCNFRLLVKLSAGEMLQWNNPTPSSLCSVHRLKTHQYSYCNCSLHALTVVRSAIDFHLLSALIASVTSPSSSCTYLTLMSNKHALICSMGDHAFRVQHKFDYAYRWNLQRSLTEISTDITTFTGIATKFST